jgi:hypothetical protein
VAEAKTLRKEITRIAADYDIEWKGELENLADEEAQGKALAERIKEADSGAAMRKSDKSHRESESDSSSAKSVSSRSGSSSGTLLSKSDTGPDVNNGKGNHLDIDRTIDEASDLADQTQLQQEKERAAQRKGEVLDDESEGRGVGSKARQESVQQGRERGKREVGKNHERFED